MFERAVGNYGKNLAVLRKNPHVLMCCPELRVAWPILDCYAAVMLPALALRPVLVDPFRGLVVAIWIGCHHADRLFAYG